MNQKCSAFEGHKHLKKKENNDYNTNTQDMQQLQERVVLGFIPVWWGVRIVEP